MTIYLTNINECCVFYCNLIDNHLTYVQHSKEYLSYCDLIEIVV